MLHAIFAFLTAQNREFDALVNLLCSKLGLWAVFCYVANTQ